MTDSNTKSDLDCEACTDVSKEEQINQFSKYFVAENKWSNLIPYESLSGQDFNDLQKVFHTRYVYVSDKDSFKKGI
ncbi:MAG: hypothetical protein ACXVCP_16245 [Bdellovibrio sp.]